MKPPSALHAVRLRTTHRLGDLVELNLDLLGVTMTIWREADRDATVFEQFFPRRRDADVLARKLRRLLAEWDGDDRWSLRLRRLRPENWAESWKRHFRATRVSDRIIIRPTWSTGRTRAGDCVITLDPGMSFGTGQHATTRHCLRFIDRLVAQRRPATFLDAGCGSGILAIAAAKLGVPSVVAVDSDPVAVRATRENLELNGVAGAVTARVADAGDARTRARYDVVAANILADALIACAPRLAARLTRRPEGRLILSGILTTQYAAVRARYARLGLKEVGRLTDGEWTSGCFARRATS